MKILDKVKIVKLVDCLPEIDIGHTGIIFDICEGSLDDELQTCYGVSADDLMNDSVPSFRVLFINALIKKQEVGLLYYCRCQLVDIITMIDVANTADDLNLELLKVLVGDIKKVFGDKL